MKLRTDDLRVGYSPAERELFGMLSLGRKAALSSRELVEKRYGAKPPYHALSIVGSTIRSLSRKIEHNAEPFRLKRSERHGPNPISFWLEKN